MKGLCDRYNRAIDSIVQLVSLQLNLQAVVGASEYSKPSIIRMSDKRDRNMKNPVHS
jgi:hypothetical protein